MKPFFSILFLFLSLLSYAQNWAPINSTEQFNYSLGEADVITHSIKVDSVHVNETDSVLFLNRIIAPCDTCSISETLEFGYMEGNFWIKNQPQFLLEHTTVDELGVWVFGESNSFFLLPSSGLGDTWTFSESLGIDATISEIVISDVLGTLDSLKTILLSTGEELVLSKNHGLTKFPDFNSDEEYILKGIEGRDIGELLPRFEDISNFQEGDIIQYYKKRSEFSTVNGEQDYQSCKGIEHLEVTDVENYTDSVIVTCHRIVNDTCHDIIIDEYSYTISEEDITKKYYRSYYETYNPIPNSLSQDNYGNYYSCRYHITSYGIKIQSFGGHCFINEVVDGFYLNDLAVLSNFGIDSHDYLLGGEESIYQQDIYGYSIRSFANSNGLGKISSKDSFSNYFNNGSEGFTNDNNSFKYVVAYSKANGDSEGELIPEDVLLTTNELDNNELEIISIYPNPASEHITLVSTNQLASVSVFSQIGEEVLQINLNGNSHRLNIEGLSSGVYVAKITSKDGRIYSERFVKE